MPYVTFTELEGIFPRSAPTRKKVQLETLIIIAINLIDLTHRARFLTTVSNQRCLSLVVALMKFPVARNLASMGNHTTVPYVSSLGIPDLTTLTSSVPIVVVSPEVKLAITDLPEKSFTPLKPDCFAYMLRNYPDTEFA